MVYGTSTSFTIPKEGYLSMIGDNGYVMRFEYSFLIKKLVENLKKTKKPRLRATGPIGLGDLVNAQIVDFPGSFQYPYLIGDSILLAIKVNHHAKPPYIIQFLNLFDEVIETDTIFGNWKTFDVRRFLNKDSIILFQAKDIDNEWHTNQSLLKSATENSKTKKLSFDLSRIPQNEDDQLIYKIAIYDFNFYFYDQLFLLYQLERSNYQPQNKIFSNYIAQQKKKYQFELFDFHK